MSKAAALEMLTGTPSQATSGSLVTGEIPKDVTPATEVTPPASETPAAKPEPQSDRLAILVKKEAALQKERETLKKEREAWLAEKTEADQLRTRIKEFDETAKKDKMAALRMIGWSDEDIVNIIAASEQKATDPIEEARRIATEEAQKLRQEIADEKVKAEKERNNQLIGKLKNDILSTIEKEAEKFEICAFRGPEAQEQVYEVIVENLKTNNELLSVNDALAIVEEYYEEEAKALQGLKKFKAATPLEAPKLNGEPPKSNTPQPAKSKTLTNSVTATSTAAIPRRETPEIGRAHV